MSGERDGEWHVTEIDWILFAVYVSDFRPASTGLCRLTRVSIKNKLVV